MVFLSSFLSVSRSYRSILLSCALAALASVPILLVSPIAVGLLSRFVPFDRSSSKSPSFLSLKLRYLGSGIGEVKCHLNGVTVPRLFNVETLLSKIASVIMAVKFVLSRF